MGILANHVPSIEPLRPGVVEVIESGNTSKKWFGEKRMLSSP
jgi:F-type H+-transporting ATPase subunit delta